MKTTVKSNLIRQNCYLLDRLSEPRSNAHEVQKTYPELRITTHSNGTTEELVEMPYNITPETVKSFRDGCDYKTDPMGAIARGHQRQNLGDVSGMQEFLGMDFSTAHDVYTRLKSTFDNLKKPVAPVAPQAKEQVNG